MHKGGAKTVVLFRVVNARFSTDIFKGAVSFLMIKRITLSRQPARTTHNRHTAKLAKVLCNAARFSCVRGVWRKIARIDLSVTWNKKIEAAVAIVIAPARTCAPAPASDADFFRNVCERAVAIVAVET